MNKIRKIVGALLVLMSLAVVCLGALLVVPSFMSPTFNDYVSAEPVTDDGFPGIDWASLRERNPDVIGWVQVPGTAIDYPIVQAPAADPEFYLTHDFDRNWNWVGSPYLDATCAEKGLLSPESLIFGHSLINGSMFSDFQYMTDPTFAEEHHEVLLMTPEWNKRLDVVMVRWIDANNEQKITGLTSGKEALEHMTFQASQAEVVRDLPADIARSWCFVTCSYQTNNSRTLTYCIER